MDIYTYILYEWISKNSNICHIYNIFALKIYKTEYKKNDYLAFK
jgi:hypothetical protein